MIRDLRIFLQQLTEPRASLLPPDLDRLFAEGETLFEELSILTTPLEEMSRVLLQQDPSFYTPLYQLPEEAAGFLTSPLFSGASSFRGTLFSPFHPFERAESPLPLSSQPFQEQVLPRPDPDFLEILTPTPDAPIPLNLSGETTTTTLDTENVFPFALVTIGGNPLPNEVTVTVTLDDFLTGSLSGGGFAPSGPGEFIFTGTVAEALLALQSLIFNPTDAFVPFGGVSSTQFTLLVESSDQIASSASTIVLATPALATNGGDNVTLPFAISTGLVNMRNGSDHLTLSSLGPNTLSVERTESLTGGSQNDTVTLPFAQTLTVDLQGGFDTLQLANGTTTLTMNHVERLLGTAGNNTVRLDNPVTDLDIDFGAGGNDRVLIHSGVNSVSLSGVELLRNRDGGNQDVTLLNNVSGLEVNLGGGGGDRLTLASGANTLKLSSSTDIVIGSSLNDTLTLTAPFSNSTIDLGGGQDILSLSGGTTRITALGIESVQGEANNNTFQLNNAVSGLDVDLGGGSDFLRLANGVNDVTVTDIERVRGGNSSDHVLFKSVLLATDRVDLRSGSDTLELASSDHTLTLSELRNIEVLKTGSSANYDLTLTNNIVGSGRSLTVDGTLLGSSHFLSLDASLESNGFLTLLGGEGADTLIGGGRPDRLKGGLGADTLTGNGGSDIFDFDILFNGPADVIKDFSQGPGGDILDIADLLGADTTYNGGLGGPLSDFVQFTDNALDSFVQIDPDGSGNGSFFLTIAILEGGAGATLTTMIGEGNLDVSP